VVIAVLGLSMLLPFRPNYSIRAVACGYGSASGAPGITSITPSSSPTGGGATVAISGCQFTGTTSVTIGGATAQWTFVSDAQVNATVPPGQASGTVFVQVTNGFGPSAPASFEYFAMYTMDGWGGMHGNDSLFPLNSPSYWFGWSIARAAHVWPLGTADEEGFLLDGWGGLHAFSISGTALSERLGDARKHQWQGFDIARDFAFTPDGKGGFVLDGFGGLHGFGLGGNPTPVAFGAPYWAGWDIARKVIIGADSKGGYVMDAFGGLHPFGIGGPAPTTLSSIESTGYWPGWQIARDIALIPGNGGYSGYVLDGFGGMHPFHPTGDFSLLPSPITTSYPGFDIIRSVWFVPGSVTDGYTLDGWGGPHPFGNAAGITTHAYWTGWDITRAIFGG
jgi:IPT/TIG domain